MPQHWDSVGAVDAMNASLAGTISDVKQLTPFSFDWPQGIEEFESGWEFTLDVHGQIHRIRHGLGGRAVYGVVLIPPASRGFSTHVRSSTKEERP
jgi:hypothetical protein